MNRSVPSNRYLIDKLEKEGMPLINEIEDALIFRNSKLNTFGRRNIDKLNLSTTEGQKRINYAKAIKFIHKFNKKMTNSIDNYTKKSKENDFFKKQFHRIKKIQKNIPSIENEKMNYVFGNLLKKYEEKGLKISKEYIDRDIYKECGLLLMNNDLNKFYKHNFALYKNEKGKKAEKNISFLNKIKKQAQKLYNKRLLERKNLEDEMENVIYFNGNNNNQENNNNNNLNKGNNIFPENKQEIRNKRQNLSIFLNKVNIIIREIKEEKEEIKKLKKLILEEEKMITLQRKKYHKENNLNIKNEESSEFPNQRRSKKTKTINPIMSLHFGKRNKNDKKKLISEESNIFSSNDNINKENTSQSNILNIQNNNNPYSESTNLTNNNIKETRNQDYLNKLYKNFSIANIMKKRSSTISLYKEGNKKLNRQKSFVNLKKSRRKSFEIPKSLKTSLTVTETYEKISNLDFISFEKNTNKKREKIRNLLKKYYGKKYQEFNKKNNHIQILNNYLRLKEEIIRSEKNNDLYEYRNVLPKLVKKKIEITLEQNKKLKNYGNLFIQTFYDKKLKD